MWATVIICVCLGTNLHAGSIITSFNITTSSSTISDLDRDSPHATATPSSSHFVIEDELAKISATCLSSRDYEQLAGNFVKHAIARTFSTGLIFESAESIGFAELRRALNFAPPRRWGPYNGTKPSEAELAAAASIEAYYDLREPRSRIQSLDSIFFFEATIATAVAFLDQRLPSVRIIFRRSFEEMHRINEGKIDRKAIDRWIDEMFVIYGKIEKAILQMHKNDRKCWGVWFNR